MRRNLSCFCGFLFFGCFFNLVSFRISSIYSDLTLSAMYGNILYTVLKPKDHKVDFKNQISLVPMFMELKKIFFNENKQFFDTFMS